MKKQPEEPKKKETPRPPEEGRREGIETYLAPPPPSKARIIGLDCHPDTFTAAVFKGSTPHDARKLSSHPDMTLKKFLDWAARDFTRDDLFLMEAGSNSFEIHRRLLALGLCKGVLENEEDFESVDFLPVLLTRTRFQRVFVFPGFMPFNPKACSSEVT